MPTRNFSEIIFFILASHLAPGHEEVIAQALPVDDDISNGVLVGVSLGQPTDNIDLNFLN